MEPDANFDDDSPITGVPLRFLKDRAEEVLTCIREGKPISPPEGGWNMLDMLQLAGLLTLGAGTHPNSTGECYRGEDLMAGVYAHAAVTYTPHTLSAHTGHCSVCKNLAPGGSPITPSEATVGSTRAAQNAMGSRRTALTAAAMAHTQKPYGPGISNTLPTSTAHASSRAGRGSGKLSRLKKHARSK